MQTKLKDLEFFVVVAEVQSFTIAAEKLFVSQPALSKTIQKLEQELNVVLFDRSNRKIRLTDAGMIVYEKSKEVLNTFKNISTSIDELSELVTGEIKIGLPQIIGTFFFPKIAQLYTKKYPGVAVTIQEEGGLITEKLVEKGDLDIGLVVLPIKNNLLSTASIYKDKFVLCVSSHHPLAIKQSVSLIDLKHESFILFAKSFALHKLVMNACKDAGFVPKIAYESTQWDLILELVSAQLGIALVPRVFADKLNGIDIVLIPMNDPELVWNVGYITNNNSYQSFALKAFIKTINEVYPWN